mmetsp:Transcript_315/g.364  ORF Transcript_315/g.364 Transcript_315/m.364 type:complete len:231 (-) Transcript_315:109-801(-)
MGHKGWEMGSARFLFSMSKILLDILMGKTHSKPRSQSMGNSASNTRPPNITVRSKQSSRLGSRKILPSTQARTVSQEPKQRTVLRQHLRSQTSIFSEVKLPFNVRIAQATSQLIQDFRKEISQDSGNFVSSWAYLKELIVLLPTQLPNKSLQIAIDDQLIAKVARFKSGLKLIGYLGFMKHEDIMYISSSHLQELQRRWALCEKAVRSARLHLDAFMEVNSSRLISIPSR